jgi:hypothetical protein
MLDATKRRFRINKDAKPYQGRILEASRVTETHVTGLVVVSKAKTATGTRIYPRSDLTEITEP